MNLNKTTKPFQITKQLVWEAYKRVCAKGGTAGIDNQTIEEFNKDVKHNLYKIWNRMASGSYFPPAVKRVEIPKADGGYTPAWHTDSVRPHCTDGCEDGL